MHHSQRNKCTHTIGYHDRQTKNYHSTTNTTQAHIPNSKSEKNLIILQVNINGLKTNSMSSNCLFTTHMQISSQFMKPSSPLKSKHLKYITSQQCEMIGCTRQEVGSSHNITFTIRDIPSTINTHNTELQMVHINNTKHITIAIIYIPPRDRTSTHYKTVDTDIQHCIQHITNIPHSVLTGDVNAHSILWHSYTDDHRGQLIADVISNSDHITQIHQPECQTPHYNKHLHRILPRYPTHYTTGHRGQLNTHYHQTTYPSSPQLTYDRTTDYNKTDGHSPTTRKLTGHNSRKTLRSLSI